MNSLPTGTTPPIDPDGPRTTVSDGDGAAMKRGGAVVGTVRTRGPNRRPAKERVTIRFDTEVLNAFRATGAGWQTRMNEALKDWLRTHTLSA